MYCYLAQGLWGWEKKQHSVEKKKANHETHATHTISKLNNKRQKINASWAPTVFYVLLSSITIPVMLIMCAMTNSKDTGRRTRRRSMHTIIHVWHVTLRRQPSGVSIIHYKSSYYCIQNWAQNYIWKHIFQAWLEQQYQTKHMILFKCYDKLSILPGKQSIIALKKDHNNSDLTIVKCSYLTYILAYS